MIIRLAAHAQPLATARMEPVASYMLMMSCRCTMLSIVLKHFSC